MVRSELIKPICGDGSPEVGGYLSIALKDELTVYLY